MIHRFILYIDSNKMMCFKLRNGHLEHLFYEGNFEIELGQNEEILMKFFQWWKEKIELYENEDMLDIVSISGDSRHLEYIGTFLNGYEKADSEIGEEMFLKFMSERGKEEFIIKDYISKKSIHLKKMGERYNIIENQVKNENISKYSMLAYSNENKIFENLKDNKVSKVIQEVHEAPRGSMKEFCIMRTEKYKK